jgi:hypothetical protein
MSTPGQRIKGQEVTLQMVTDAVLEDEITEIKDFEATFEMEIMSQGYLGQKTELKDSIFKGVTGKFTAHIHTSKAFDYIEKIKDKVQRKTPDTVFNLLGVFSFPNGETRSLTIPDVAWGSVPVSTGSRSDYTSFAFTFAAAEASNVDDT